MLSNYVKIGLLLVVAFQESPAQTQVSVDSLYALALRDLPAFSRQITGGARTDFEKTSRVVTWFAEHFDWTYTDYQKRTTQDILQRKGGNCAELAKVTRAALETLGLKMRRMREINLHVTTPRRQADAEKKVAEAGFRMSVFGKQHNDHVWLEIFDSATGEWFPADPSLGVVGKRPWLAARLGFHKRYSLDPSSADMIAPFAVFAEEDSGWVNRSRYYTVEGLDELYFGQASRLPSWQRWQQLADSLDDKARAAFEGRENLHRYGAAIEALGETYERLRREFWQTDLGRIFQNIDAFSANLVAGEFAKVAGAYCADAKIFPDRLDILSGRETLERYWTPAPDSKNRTVHHRVMPEEIKITGEEAYDWGYYEGKTRLADGKESVWRGKYVIVWRKTTEGDWKIYLDIWNRVLQN